MYQCCVLYQVGNVQKYNFCTEVESHPEDISINIWQAMIANSRGYKRPVKILDVSWSKTKPIIHPANKRKRSVIQKLSRDARMFFQVEENNVKGVQPATLSSAMSSLSQAPDDTLLSWCGYDPDKYPKDLTKEMRTDLEREIKRLITNKGARRQLLNT